MLDNPIVVVVTMIRGNEYNIVAGEHRGAELLALHAQVVLSLFVGLGNVRVIILYVRSLGPEQLDQLQRRGLAHIVDVRLVRQTQDQDFGPLQAFFLFD